MNRFRLGALLSLTSNLQRRYRCGMTKGRRFFGPFAVTLEETVELAALFCDAAMPAIHADSAAQQCRAIGTNGCGNMQTRPVCRFIAFAGEALVGAAVAVRSHHMRRKHMPACLTCLRCDRIIDVAELVVHCSMPLSALLTRALQLAAH